MRVEGFGAPTAIEGDYDSGHGMLRSDMVSYRSYDILWVFSFWRKGLKLSTLYLLIDW